MALGPKEFKVDFFLTSVARHVIGQPLDSGNCISLLQLMVEEQKDCERNFLGCVSEH